MKLELRIGNRTRNIEIERRGEQFHFRIDGRDVAADVSEVQSEVYSILIGGDAFEARVESGAGELRVRIDGREFSIAIADPRQWRRGGNAVGTAEGYQQVVASMPGKVVRVMVHTGDAVAAGQGLLVVEAMKMQNEIKSPKAGRIKRIAAREGQTVNAGEILAVIA
ncbi:MAG TPA: biotin/lipoyl-containing protein [Candidatus Acidoferrales bacterium]|nr:biotin/lipoyl-containing protein [Candidatus Acidoferrales bacterium]